MSSRVESIGPDEDIEIAANRMASDEIRRLVGVLSHGNLTRAPKVQGGTVEATRGVTRGA